MRKHLVTMVSFIGIYVLSVFFQGCEQESLFENSSHLDCLELESYVLNDMSKTDMDNLGQAMLRLDIYIEDGIYHIKQNSGAQVNISEKLYHFIKNSYNHTNKIFKSNSKNFSLPRLKSGGIEDPPKTDCVAWSLFGMGGVSYSTANA
jgi:hypothetical protein